MEAMSKETHHEAWLLVPERTFVSLLFSFCLKLVAKGDTQPTLTLMTRVCVCVCVCGYVSMCVFV